jgi:hypothetical protein
MIKTFCTGLHTIADLHPNLPCEFKGSGWMAILSNPRTGHSQSNSKEIVIKAKSWETAQRAVELIHCCHLLQLGCNDVFGIDVMAFNNEEPGWLEEPQRSRLSEISYGTCDLDIACALAARASRHLSWHYAVTKFRFSVTHCSVPSVDLEPFRSPHLSVSPFPRDQVKFAHALVCAYSIIEDLGLEIRASKDSPSRIGGDWNPTVKLDLEKRLEQAGVDYHQPILWIARGGRKRIIEHTRPIPKGTKPRWAVWTVRDREIPLVDAIAYASWLRSRVASHGFNDYLQALSPYDVINVQEIAQRLLLEVLGYWRMER